MVLCFWALRHHHQALGSHSGCSVPKERLSPQTLQGWKEGVEELADDLEVVNTLPCTLSHSHPASIKQTLILSSSNANIVELLSAAVTSAYSAERIFLTTAKSVLFY